MIRPLGYCKWDRRQREMVEDCLRSGTYSSKEDLLVSDVFFNYSGHISSVGLALPFSPPALVGERGTNSFNPHTVRGTVLNRIPVCARIAEFNTVGTIVHFQSSQRFCLLLTLIHHDVIIQEKGLNKQ